MTETIIQKINENIEFVVKNGKYLSLKTHRMTDSVEKHILFALETILKKTEHERYIHSLYTILKELVINGCKANQKRIFFEERGYDINNSEHYAIGIEEYKKSFSEEMAIEYGKKSKEKGLYVLMDFEFDEDGIRIEVINNSTISPQEERLMREKLKKAMGYNDLAEFYMDQAMSGEAEGAGLGLALVIILLKGEGIDPNYFRIIIEKDKTIARLEIPFTENFVSKRKSQQH
ncbi:MAG: histidine kinase [Leptospiraceae bacterium]|nr:histidine kinase [Leptospiraceae bacterium]MDW7976304.1 histidine kinase [Leptospiraceae bacterium]